MKNWLVLLLCFSFSPLLACDCPPLKDLTLGVVGDYNVIFLGKVESVAPCDEKGNSMAIFNISELYDGASEKKVKINFDCMSSCMMSFAPGEEWIIYARYEKFDQLKVDFCEHSRKRPQGNEIDVYMVNGRTDFDKEAALLKEWVGLNDFLEPNKLKEQREEVGRRNEQPSGANKLWLLLISLVAMGGIWYFTRKKK